MDYSGVVSIISSVGFPIAMCLILCWFVYNQTNVHKEEVKQLTEAVNKLTLAMSNVKCIAKED